MFTKLSQHASVAKWTALEEHLQRLENGIHTFNSKLDTMMEGMENDDLSLWNVEEENWPLNPHLDEDPNGWQTIALKHMSILCLHLFILLMCTGWGWWQWLSGAVIEQGKANDALEGLRLAWDIKPCCFKPKWRFCFKGSNVDTDPDSGGMLGAIGRTLWLEGKLGGPKTNYQTHEGISKGQESFGVPWSWKWGHGKV